MIVLEIDLHISLINELTLVDKGGRTLSQNVWPVQFKISFQTLTWLLNWSYMLHTALLDVKYFDMESVNDKNVFCECECSHCKFSILLDCLQFSCFGAASEM